MSEQFNGIRACVFDAYGTLFDVHSAVGRHDEEMGSVGQRLSQLWRTKQLEYTWLRSLMGRHADFWQVTGEALDYALDAFDMGDRRLRDKLMNAYLTLAPYPEALDALRSLKDRGLRLGILSNGSPDMLAAAVNNAGMADLMDAVMSVEEVGIFKPDPRVYQLAVDRLQVQPHEISFQSSNSWDAHAAAAFGFRVAWINRFDQRRERIPETPHAEIRSLDQLTSILT